jgi:hypothetical protein
MLSPQVLAMFGVGSFFIPLAAEACSRYLGDPLAVFWLVGATSLASTVPFLFVTSPTRPPPATDDKALQAGGGAGDEEEGSDKVASATGAIGAVLKETLQSNKVSYCFVGPPRTEL